MSRVHDMGGRLGDGPIPETDDDQVFHTEWEARALALNLACGALGAWNIDASRHARECLAPKDYAAFSYYEKWLGGLTDILVAHNLLSEADLDRSTNAATTNNPLPPSRTLDPRALRAENVSAAMQNYTPYTRADGPKAMFSQGDTVRVIAHTRNAHVQGGHTRLPSYAVGRKGVIERLQGNHVFPDSNAHFLGQAPQPLYAVRFTAQELWGDDAEQHGDDLVLDLWQSYLEEPV